MDAGANSINKAVRRFREVDNPKNIHFFKSLPIEFYAPLLKNAACILGNSSSGIRESAFLGTPTVNIGTRQNGRERGKNVVDVAYETAAIVSKAKNFELSEREESGYVWTEKHQERSCIKLINQTIEKNIAWFHNCTVLYSCDTQLKFDVHFPENYKSKAIDISSKRFGFKITI